MFTALFCQALLEELEHFEQSDLPKGRPNTMNNYGVGEALPCGRRRRGLLVWGNSPAALWPSGMALCLPRSLWKMKLLKDHEVKQVKGHRVRPHQL